MPPNKITGANAGGPRQLANSDALGRPRRSVLSAALECLRVPQTAFSLFEVMDIQGIREALHRQPFEPFTIRLADGRAFSVPHSDYVALGQRRIIVVDRDDDRWSVIEPLLIVSLDYNGTASAPNKGG